MIVINIFMKIDYELSVSTLQHFTVAIITNERNFKSMVRAFSVPRFGAIVAGSNSDRGCFLSVYLKVVEFLLVRAKWIV